MEKVPDGFELLDIGEVDLDVDETAGSDRSFAVIDESLVSVLRKDTRVGLARGTVELVETGETGRAGYDVPLMCIVDAHPDSTVRWARIVVDLVPTGDATVEDMSPQSIKGDRPVEVKTTVAAGLSFSAIAKAVDAEIKPEITRSRTVYFPELRSSGPGFRQAYWTFLPGDQPSVHVDRELRLLISAPSEVPLEAQVTIRVKVAPKGVAALIPFVARVGGAGRTYRLA